jgi:hypothetical protein
MKLIMNTRSLYLWPNIYFSKNISCLISLQLFYHALLQFVHITYNVLFDIYAFWVGVFHGVIKNSDIRHF